MRKQGGGFGFVMLLVVLIIIFFVAMRNFETVAPSAMAVQKHNAQRKSGDGAAPTTPEGDSPSKSASADSWTPAPPSRPNLSTMDQKTTEHTSDVQDALSQSN